MGTSGLGGAVIFLPEKNTQCPNVKGLKLSDKRALISRKTKGFTILTSTETVIFKPRRLYVLYWQVYSILLNQKVIKEKGFPSVALSENIS